MPNPLDSIPKGTRITGFYGFNLEVLRSGKLLFALVAFCAAAPALTAQVAQAKAKIEPLFTGSVPIGIQPPTMSALRKDERTADNLKRATEGYQNFLRKYTTPAMASGRETSTTARMVEKIELIKYLCGTDYDAQTSWVLFGRGIFSKELTTLKNVRALAELDTDASLRRKFLLQLDDMIASLTTMLSEKNHSSSAALKFKNSLIAMFPELKERFSPKKN